MGNEEKKKRNREQEFVPCERREEGVDEIWMEFGKYEEGCWNGLELRGDRFGHLLGSVMAGEDQHWKLRLSWLCLCCVSDSLTRYFQ